MKKIIILFLVFCFAVEVNAHPGGTDENGGHYNRSTGEYHYHHGFPEHQHTDGICPYDYINAEEDKNSFVEEKVDEYDFEDDADIEYLEDIDEEKGNEIVIPLVLIGVVGVLNIIVKVLDSKSKTTNQVTYTNALQTTNKTNYQHKKTAIISDTLVSNQKERQYYFDLYANIDPITLVEIPKDVYLRDGIPVTDGNGKYGRYTVYITPSGKCFHQDPTCCHKHIEKHIFEVAKSHKPCLKCVLKPFPEYKWFIEYRKIVKIKEKYNIP